MKFNIIFFLLLSIISLSCSTTENQGSMPDEDPPNIVWLVSEDNSPFIGVYGDSLARTPRIDRFASEGLLYENAFANAPVCAPSRSTLIMGMYATSLGTQHMRCMNPVPEFVHFFPFYLKEKGYFTTNRQKKDYNTFDQEGVWDNNWWDWKDAFIGKDEKQPFFLMYNTWMSHEDKIHSDEKAAEYYRLTLQALLGREFSEAEIIDSLKKFSFQPGDIPLPPYHPPTDAMYSDWARYYNRVQMMDEEIGIVLDLLEREGLMENTIVFYFSDHGGVLPRSKRFPFESGLKVPLIVRIPEKYGSIAPESPGGRTKQLVSFVDLAPTVLELCGIEPPDHMQGRAFLGSRVPDEPDEETVAYGFRGRMDERYDMVRTVRDKKYRYRLNFMPHRIYGQHIRFLWRAPSMQSWEKAFREGETNRLQSRFFTPKFREELYDINLDPDCVSNLALNSSNGDLVSTYRDLVTGHMKRIKDTGIIPESMMMELSEGSTPFEYMRALGTDYDRVLNAALTATEGKRKNLPALGDMLSDEHPAIRYWGATGCVILQEGAVEMKDLLINLLNDKYVNVRIAACEALYGIGEPGTAIDNLEEILQESFRVLQEKENSTPGFAREVFELTHALNVVTCLGNTGRQLDDEIREIAGKEKSDYAKRAAEYLVEEK